ncbi:MAG TPA: hypothetical protein PKC49_05555 [Phycisphaerae bacterium]|nr:hypothetical protein [Phycisphaerae bacterium]
MPHLAHGLTGLAIGVASVGESRRPAVHAGWLGACVTLAYLPDLIEWLLLLCGVRTARSAPASLPVSMAAALAVIAIVRLALRETRWPILVAAGAAVLSHSLLDALDGGIPALWPWSAETFGWEDAFGLDAGRGAGRVHAEAVLFMPLLALGLLIRAGRLGREPDRLVALLALAATFSAAVFPLGLLVLFSLVICAAAAWRVRPRVWTWGLTANLAAMAPVVLLGVVQWHSHWNLREGERLRVAGRCQEAIGHYHAARRFGALDSVTDPLYYEALCLNELDRPVEALALLEDYLRRDPDNDLMLYGLAHLRITARDPHVQDFVEGRRLAGHVAAESRSEHYRGLAQRLLESAQAAPR